MGRKIGAENIVEYLGGIGISDRLRRTLVGRLFDLRGHPELAVAHGIKAASSRQRQWRARRLASRAGLNVPLPPKPVRPRRLPLSLLNL